MLRNNVVTNRKGHNKKGPLSESLEKAIDSNLKLQVEIASQLAELAREKAENRRKASCLLEQLGSCWHGHDVKNNGISETVLADPPIEPIRILLQEAIKKKQQSQEEAGNQSGEVGNSENKVEINSSAAEIQDDDAGNNKRSTIGTTKAPKHLWNQTYLQSKWRYDPYRRWKGPFFMDPDGSTPEVNSDTVKRRKIEEDGAFLYHISPPWTKKESKTLGKIVDDQQVISLSADSKIQQAECQRKMPGTDKNLARLNLKPVPQALKDQMKKSQTQQQIVHDQQAINVSHTTNIEHLEYKRQTIEDDNCLANIDFELVAEKLADQLKGDRAVLPTAKKRSAEECWSHYVHNIRKNSCPSQPSKQELAKIMELVEEQQKRHQNINEKNDANEYAQSEAKPLHLTVDWTQIAEALGTGRMPFQCLQAYQNKLQSDAAKSGVKWTPVQDELLLKYVAAMGPQFVVDMTSISQLTARFFPDKSTKHVLHRINHSLLNPNLIKDLWSEDDERKLVLCMKVYRDCTADKSSSMMNRVAAHFPNRSTKSVFDKWNRSLNPEYSYSPFTKSEEKKLLEIVRKKGFNGRGGWTQIAREHFPNRHPQQLSSRWAMSATEQDIIQKHYKEKQETTSLD